MGTAKQFEVADRKRKEKLGREHKLVSGIDHKLCSQHYIHFPKEDIWFPATTEYFYSSKNKTDYLQPYCKKCNIAKSYINIVENYDRFKEGLKTYRQSEKGRKQEKDKNIRLKESGTRKKWWQANPEKTKGYTAQHREHDIYENEWQANKEYFNNECAYCGLPSLKHIVYKKDKYITMKFHKEHVDCEGYNDIRNCVPSCRDCNSGKRAKTLDEFFERGFIEGFTKERYNKIVQWITEDYKKYIIEKPPYRVIKKKDQGTGKFYHNLWSVDEMRNTIEVLASEVKKKDLNIHIERLFPKIEQ